MKNAHKQKKTTLNLQYFLSCELSFIFLCYKKPPTKQPKTLNFCAQFNNWKDISQIYTSICVNGFKQIYMSLP